MIIQIVPFLVWKETEGTLKDARIWMGIMRTLVRSLLHLFLICLYSNGNVLRSKRHFRNADFTGIKNWRLSIFLKRRLSSWIQISYLSNHIFRNVTKPNKLKNLQFIIPTFFQLIPAIAQNKRAWQLKINQHFWTSSPTSILKKHSCKPKKFGICNPNNDSQLLHITLCISSTNKSHTGKRTWGRWCIFNGRKQDWPLQITVILIHQISALESTSANISSERSRNNP